MYLTQVLIQLLTQVDMNAIKHNYENNLLLIGNKIITQVNCACKQMIPVVVAVHCGRNNISGLVALQSKLTRIKIVSGETLWISHEPPYPPKLFTTSNQFYSSKFLVCFIHRSFPPSKVCVI